MPTMLGRLCFSPSTSTRKNGGPSACRGGNRKNSTARWRNKRPLNRSPAGDLWWLYFTLWPNQGIHHEGHEISRKALVPKLFPLCTFVSSVVVALRKLTHCRDRSHRVRGWLRC